MTSTRQDVTTAIRGAATELRAAGVPSPQADAELLAAHVLNVDRGRVHAVAWSGEQSAEYATLVRRRAERIPLQHLTGTAPFRTIELAVGPGVFIPRPETESVVEAALDRLNGAAVVVDMCAGSGAIALAIATERPSVEVHAVEADPAASVWLRRNTEALRPGLALGSTVRVHEVPVADAVVGPLAGPVGIVDLVISNPPYIPDGAVPRDPEVARHDPAMALFGGPDGMDVVREVAAQAAVLLRRGGVVLLEHGEQQGPQVQEVLGQSGLGSLESGTDLGGRPRWSAGRL